MTRCHVSAALCPLLLISLGRRADSPNNSTSPPQSDLSSLTVVERNPYVSTTVKSELDRPITVALQGLRNWMKSTGKSPEDLRLNLAGQNLSTSSPTLTSAQEEYVNFRLEVESGDRNAWVRILYAARQAPDHKIPLSIGWKDNMEAFDSKVEMALEVYPRYTAFIVGLLVALLAATLILSSCTDLLRDGTSSAVAPARSPYDLGKVQMAFWFYLVIAAYLYVWLITGEYNTVTNSVLALIGISTGTGMAAVFLDKQKAQEVLTRQASLETQRTALTSRINALNAAAPEPGSQLYQELQQRKNGLNEVQAQLEHFPAPLPPAVSNGFLKDILSSGEGVGLHRFQMAVWTLIFGIIFVRSVYRELEMPNFDPSLLGLMGLSSGTFIGFKVPEKLK